VAFGPHADAIANICGNLARAVNDWLFAGISFPIFVGPRWGKHADRRIRDERIVMAAEKAKAAEISGTWQSQSSSSFRDLVLRVNDI
jgi:hypothetical protein